MGKTIGTLAVFVIIGLLPKVPWWAKLIVQLVIGVGIYFMMPDGEFPLPDPDNNPIGAQLYGGDAAKAMGISEESTFAFLSMGVIGTVLGFLSTGIGTLIWYLVGKKKES